MEEGMNLYQIDAELAEIEQAIIDAGGEVTEETEAKLHEILDSREDKVDGYIAVIKSNLAIAKAFKVEEDRLKANRTARENTAKRLKERLYESMRQHGDTELVGNLGKAKIQNNGGKVPVEVLADVDSLPERFQRVTVDADMDAIRDALESQDESVLQFAQMGEKGTHLRIY